MFLNLNQLNKKLKNLDKLYGKKEGDTAAPPAEGGDEISGGMPSMGSEPPLESPAAPESPAPPIPESTTETMNILLENTGMLGEDEVIDLSRGGKSLGQMGEQLDKLLRS